MIILWLKTQNREAAERGLERMPKDTDIRWYVSESGDSDYPWGLFYELVRYGDGAMAADLGEVA